MSYSDIHFYSDDPVEYEEGSGKKKISGFLAFILLVVGSGFYIQTTLAANVSLNSGAPVEFGQGVMQTTSCTGSSNLTVTPRAGFVNASGGGAFMFDQVTISGIPATTKSYDFTINAFGNSSDTPLSIFNTNVTDAIINNDAGTFKLGSGSTGMSVTSGAGTFTAIFDQPVALTSSVFKVVIQCSPHQLKAGVDWEVPSIPTNDHAWFGLAYGNGMFVSVSPTGDTSTRVMTSPDGSNWTLRTTPSSGRDWSSVTFGNGQFVAVSFTDENNIDSGAMTSPDGIHWTDQPGSVSNYTWSSVTYGNGIYVASSYDEGLNSNYSMTSIDGISWAFHQTHQDQQWQAITFGNGLFVAVSSSRTGHGGVMTSTDGVTWTSRTAPNQEWYGVTYGNGLFVAVGKSGLQDGVMTSPDGITWTQRTSAAATWWSSVTYGEGKYVAVSYTGTGNRVMTSPDGITWTSRTSGADKDWVAIAYGNGVFAAVAYFNVGVQVMASSSK